MTQYCKLTGRVTNCTDNCRIYLEEETKTREIKVGDKVRYIAEDSKEDKESEFYPPKGDNRNGSLDWKRQWSVSYSMADGNDKRRRLLVH